MSDQLPAGPPDLTQQYNTALTPEQEAAYQVWLNNQSQLQGRDMSRDSYNYDMRGAFLAGAGPAGGGAGGHYPDTFKKPNHPTFSDQSQYHGVNGQQGGSWQQLPAGQWQFTPGATNRQYFSPNMMQRYLLQSDPNVQLNMPGVDPTWQMMSQQLPQAMNVG
jgi:hypothetical protein